MSWDDMGSHTELCSCGKGTITTRTEMDDWNRCRYYTTVNCAKCRAKERKEARQESEREKLFSKASRIAEKRYLDRWLARFTNKNRRQAWLLITGGSGYPALGTFYQHVKFYGLEQYLRQHFKHDFPEELKKMRIKDKEVLTLLAARGKIPERVQVLEHK